MFEVAYTNDLPKHKDAFQFEVHGFVCDLAEQSLSALKAVL